MSLSEMTSSEVFVVYKEDRWTVGGFEVFATEAAAVMRVAQRRMKDCDELVLRRWKEFKKAGAKLVKREEVGSHRIEVNVVFDGEDYEMEKLCWYKDEVGELESWYAALDDDFKVKTLKMVAWLYRLSPNATPPKYMLEKKTVL